MIWNPTSLPSATHWPYAPPASWMTLFTNRLPAYIRPSCCQQPSGPDRENETVRACNQADLRLCFFPTCQELLPCHAVPTGRGEDGRTYPENGGQETRVSVLPGFLGSRPVVQLLPNRTR